MVKLGDGDMGVAERVYGLGSLGICRVDNNNERDVALME